MASGIIDIIKRASIDAEDASKPCDLRYGTVATTSPLSIRVASNFVLPSSLLIVPKHLTDYHVTINDEDATIKAHLRVGEKVALIRQRGGQAYYILDRI